MSTWFESSEDQFCFRFLCPLSQPTTPQHFSLWYGMIVWWLCWHKPILMKNISQKPYPQFLTVHDFGKPRWGVAYVLCVANCSATSDLGGPLAWGRHVWMNTDRGERYCPIMFGAYWVVSMWRVICLQYLAIARSEQSVLPIDHVI